jgi:A/G-specific adenine glycosylase
MKPFFAHAEFATRLIAWQKKHGRHDLPWQNTLDPYAIWVSEIMLQQTQVGAVIGYYGKFMARFPTVAELASASQDEVLQLWSGLGYYSRARNLHKAAQQILTDFGGKFPQDFEAIQSLPGIGRSTAAAISAFAFHQSQTILDGNVKRVLARHFMLEGWTSAPSVEKKLWQLAESLLPQQDMIAYTQGLMDLGATLCTRSKPKCKVCPLQTTCGAYRENLTHTLPTPKPKKAIPTKEIAMLVIKFDGKILLEKRPESGIWAGLFSLPEVAVEQDILRFMLENFYAKVETCLQLEAFTHTFTHFKLTITPHLVKVKQFEKVLPEKFNLVTQMQALQMGIPTPIRFILQALINQTGY